MASPPGAPLSQAHARAPCWRHVCTVLAAFLLGGGLLLSSFFFGFESTALEPHAVQASLRAAAQAHSSAGQTPEDGAPLSTTAPGHQVLIEESTFNDLFEPRNVTTEIEEAIARDEARLAEALEQRQTAAVQGTAADVTGARSGAEVRAARKRRLRIPAVPQRYTVAGADVAKRGKGGCSLANLKPMKRKYCLTSVGHKRDCPQCPDNARCIRQRWCCFRFVCVCEQRFSRPTFDGTELVRCNKA